MQRFSGPKLTLVIITVLLGVIAACFGSQHAAQQDAAEVALLQQELAAFVSPRPVQSSNLRGLRAERYAIETRLDPLFAVAGSDTEGMRKSLIPLQGEAEEILGSYSAEARAQIEPVLYPRTFLSELPDLEEMRRALITAPTPAGVRHYDAQLRNVISAYKSDISRYRKTLSDLSESDKNTTIHYLAGTTSVSEIISKLDTLVQRADTLESDRENRYACFTGTRSKCVPLSSRFADFVRTEPPKIATEPPTSLPKSLVYRDIVHQAFSEMLGVQETRGEVVRLSRSECLSGTPSAYYYFFQSTEEEGIRSNTATPLNDLYFYNLDESVHGQKNPPAYLQELYDAGLRYNFQNIGNLYFCPNSGHVLADATTLVSIRETLQHAPLFANRADSYPELARLEKTYTGAAIPSEADMDVYFAALKDTLRTEGEHTLSVHIGNARLFEAEELIHEWSNRSSHYEQLLTAAHHINRLSKGIIKRSQAPVYAFLASRVYTSIFFMTFNQSVSGESFLFLDAINTKPSLSNFHLIPYSTGLSRTFNKAQVFNELRNEQQIIDDVLEVER